VVWGTVELLEDAVQKFVGRHAAASRVVERISEVVGDDDAHAAIGLVPHPSGAFDVLALHDGSCIGK
jgi:hypothetical protein